MVNTRFESIGYPKRENAIENAIGIGFKMNYELKYLKITVEYLSFPYKTDCHRLESKFFSVKQILEKFSKFHSAFIYFYL